MKTHRLCFSIIGAWPIVAVSLCSFVLSLQAESALPVDAVSIADAAKMRAALAADVISGKTVAAEGLTQLRAERAPLGLEFGVDANYAFAAIDIGQRLVVSGKVSEAEVFFRAAETTLESLVEQTPDEAAAEKAQLLTRLATIRVSYLDKAVRAKADFDAAIKLQPNDQVLKRLRDYLGSDKPSAFGSQEGANKEVSAIGSASGTQP